MALYLLQGDAKSCDPHLIRERLDNLLKGIPREGNLNFATYDLSETGTTLDDVVASALTIPFLGGQRVVVARNIKQVEKSFKKPNPDDDSDGQEDFKVSRSQDGILRSVKQLSSLPDDAILILVEENGRLDGRTTFYKGLKDAGCEIEAFKAMWFDPAAGNIRDAVAYIQKEASALGIRLDQRTAGVFAYRVGPNRSNILNELKKLAAYVGGGNSPTPDDVESVVTQCYEAGIFSLVDYIGQGNTDKALNELADLMDRGAVAPYILTMIVRQVRLIARVREALRRPEFQNLEWKELTKILGSELGEAPFVIGKILGQVKKFRPFKYSQVSKLLMETDVHFKRGTMQSKPPGKLALEILITKLSGRRSGVHK